MTREPNPAEFKSETKIPESEALPRSGSPSTPTPTASSRRITWRRLLFLGATVIAIGASALFGQHYWTVGRFQESTDDAYVKADTTIIAPKVSGYLREIYVNDNQAVKAGQPLAKIDDRDYQVAVDQAKADVAAAQADIDNLKARLDQQQAIIAQAQATVAVDNANVTFAQQDYERYTALAKTAAGSLQNAQQATSRIAAAKATLQRDEAAVDAAERQVTMLEAELAKANATLAHDRAVEQQAELNLSYTTIISPEDGVIGNRTLRVGQFVQAGTLLMAVVPLNNVYVVANFKETQLTDVHKGQPVEIAVDTFPDAMVKGHVDSIAPASGQEFALLPPDNATGNFTKIVQRIPVKITLDAGDALAGKLRPGMSVIPTIDTKPTAQKTASEEQVRTN